MKLLDDLERKLKAIDARSMRRRVRVTDSPCAPRMKVDGVEGCELLAFCSNDYLGLAAHPRVVEAMQEGAARYGAGSGASHLISGHSRAHALLEEKLAAFVGPHLEQARALYFCTGYMANLAMLSAFGGMDTAIFSEELNHASLIDGGRLTRADVVTYPHGDLAALEKLLAESDAKTKLVVTDSVFSMDGDLAPLPQLLTLCERYNAWLMVDDAHGFGILGEHGRGALEHFNLHSPYLIYMGTLGKAAGVGGAFVAAHETVIEWLVQRARPYIYTTAAPPAIAHALSTSIDIIAGEEGRALRKHLQSLIQQLQTSLTLRLWRQLRSTTAIQPIIIGENQSALDAAAALLEQGLWVPAIRPPTVPPNTARLRVTLSAAHTKEDVEQLASILNALEQAQTATALET
ncbi:MAG: 8-amino-7-oxononanoate synthase [Burkholderiales bacterium]|nr:8-amino-7-oxononanoate synthase [Burkholderiales bacterium]